MISPVQSVIEGIVLEKILEMHLVCLLTERKNVLWRRKRGMEVIPLLPNVLEKILLENSFF